MVEMKKDEMNYCFAPSSLLYVKKYMLKLPFEIKREMIKRKKAKNELF